MSNYSIEFDTHCIKYPRCTGCEFEGTKDCNKAFIKKQESLKMSTCNPAVVKLSKGTKFDNGKLQYRLVPVQVLEDLAAVLTFGANKYSADNWKNVEPYRYEDALFRHIAAWRKGELIDSESGKPHLAHAMACLTFLMEHDRMKFKSINGMTSEDLDNYGEQIELELKDKEYLDKLKNA